LGAVALTVGTISADATTIAAITTSDLTIPLSLFCDAERAGEWRKSGWFGEPAVCDMKGLPRVAGCK
jgi:hypothetical protein